MKTIDRKFRNVRVWSNRELEKFGNLFEGDICNVSAWQDADKEGSHYREYFNKAQKYILTNYHDKNARGTQGDRNDEIILDLTDDLIPSLHSKFDVVFNHTTLEHIFDCNKAFSNLCAMTRDIVIVVVPFLQETHGTYGDYWRFTPQVIDKSFQINGFKTLYLSYNDQAKDSIYIFAIGSKKPDAWNAIQETPGNCIANIYTKQIGTYIIKNSFFENIKNKINSFMR